MKKIRKLLFNIEVFAAALAGMSWGSGVFLAALDGFPDLPFRLTWFSLFWIPFVFWGSVFVVSRIGMASVLIIVVNDRLRKIELIAWISGLVTGVLTCLIWMLFR